jgi:hypothetical protein
MDGRHDHHAWQAADVIHLGAVLGTSNVDGVTSLCDTQHEQPQHSGNTYTAIQVLLISNLCCQAAVALCE